MIFTVILLSIVVNQINTATITNEKKNILNVAVIGAGPAGLCSARHALEQGHEVTVYEQNEEIGGVWYYTDKVGRSNYGFPIHTAMYRGLRTNVPHEIMEYPDFPYPNGTTTYPSQPEVLKYLQSYASHFGVKKHTRLSRVVIRVLPIENDKWEVIVKNLRTNKFETNVFDAVIVCNGHYSTPFIPKIPGADSFNGKIIHSHDFRKAEDFRNNSVLVIGAGSSGADLVIHLSETADRVTLSRHKILNETIEARMYRESIYPEIVTLKDDVVRFTSNGADFIDDSHQTFDVVIFATGYNYSFPFLTADAGIYYKNNLVKPLYKQIFNIEHPTMALIGVPALSATTRVFDLQARYVMKFLSGAKQLPTKSDMLKEMQVKSTKKRPFVLESDLKDYIKELSKESETEGVQDVYIDIQSDVFKSRNLNPYTFRSFKYVAIDKNSFRKEKLLI